MSDFLQKFKMYWVGNPDYWKLTEPDKIGKYAIGYYPLSFRDRLYQGHYLDFDENGIPLFHSQAGNLVHFCTGMCSFAFAHWEEFLNTSKREHAEHVLKVADYLIGMSETRDNGSLMILDYECDGLGKGITCAMNQGESISVLSRAFCLTEDKKYLQAALKMAKPFAVPYGVDGVTGKLPGNEAIWYLEGGKMILNGHNYALFGLADLVTISGDEKVKEYLQIGIQSVIDSIQYFDNGFWSWYWVNKPHYIASAMYHNLHICQLSVLARISGNEKLKKFTQKFEGYAASPFSRAKAGGYMLTAKIKRKLG